MSTPLTPMIPIVGIPVAPTAPAVESVTQTTASDLRASAIERGESNNSITLQPHHMQELSSIKREIRKIRYELVDNEHAHWRGTERMLYVMGFAMFLMLLLIVLKLYSGTLKVET